MNNMKNKNGIKNFLSELFTSKNKKTCCNIKITEITDGQNNIKNCGCNKNNSHEGNCCNTETDCCSNEGSCCNTESDCCKEE